MEIFSDFLIHLHPDDPVAIAKRELKPGLEIKLEGGTQFQVLEVVPAGHKIALVDVPAGGEVRRYGYRIGCASAQILAGSWVHSHNLAQGKIVTEPPIQVIEPLQPAPTRRAFLGYRRSDGRVGTRNYIAVISTVSCSAHVVSQVARAFSPERLEPFENVDGVIPIVHSSGCSLPPGGLSYRYLKRSLANLSRNPNIAAAIYIGLGCEVMQVDDCQPLYSDKEIVQLVPQGFVIQDQGGFQKTVAAGVAAVQDLLSKVNAIPRTSQSLAGLVVALQCGGSDGWSGVTANPLVGRVVDALVLEGGTAALAETTEVFGAEHLLTRRVTSRRLAEKLLQRMAWWSEEARRRGFSIDNNPTPGNKKGGLTTIYEKSLGAIAKAGSSPLNGVYEYGEWIDRRGLVLVDTPGNDPVSVTGQLASGCNLVLFTTGRGSVYGSAMAPTIKIATNSSLYERMEDDMDFNAGQILEGGSWGEATQDLIDLIVAVASGTRTRSETHGLSENEFVPWQPDAVL